MIFTVDVRVYGFNFIVCVEYLLKISQFFTSYTTPEDPSAKPTTAVKPQKPGVPAAAAAAAAPPATEVKPYMLTLNLRVEKPDIILVESIEDLNTNALILHVSSFSFVFVF